MKKGSADKDTRRVRLRAQVSEHLKKLLLAGAAAGPAITGACGCVCDPMPYPYNNNNAHEPVACEERYDVSSARLYGATVAAQWIWLPTEEFAIDVTARLGPGGYDWINWADPPVSSDATVLIQQLDLAGEYVFVRLAYDASDTEVQLILRAECSGHALYASFDLDTSATPLAGELIPAYSY